MRKLFILNPIRSVMTDSFIESLKKIKGVQIELEVKDLLTIDGITDQDTEKILALDPDFCEWNLSRDTLKQIPNLKTIIVSSTDYSWVDAEYIRENNIEIVNCKGFSTEAVANWGLSMMLDVARKLPIVMKKEYELDYEADAGLELKGKKVGIIGLGNIGSRFAELCLGIGMDVHYWSKKTRDSRFKYSELEEIFKNCDVIYPILPSGEDTKGIITDELIRNVKRSAIFVSNAKGSYNHELVLELAEKGDIYGYAFESTEGAKRLKDFKGNVWASPSVGWMTEETYQRNGEIWLENIKSNL